MNKEKTKTTNEWEEEITKILKGHGGSQADNPLVISSIIWAIKQVLSTRESEIRAEERESLKLDLLTKLREKDQELLQRRFNENGITLEDVEEILNNI